MSNTSEEPGQQQDSFWIKKLYCVVACATYWSRLLPQQYQYWNRQAMAWGTLLQVALLTLVNAWLQSLIRRHVLLRGTCCTNISLYCYSYLQICNYLSLSASHICPLRSSSRSVCLRIAFECHFGVILVSTDQSCKSVTADVLSVYLYCARRLVCESPGYDRSQISAVS